MSAWALDPVWLTGTILHTMGPLVTGLSVLFLVSALDDLLIDLTFWWHRILRGRRGQLGWVDAVDHQALMQEAQRPIAVMIPAWDESAVLGPMLSRLLASADYERLRVFVGTYPNDHATREVLARIIAREPRVTEVVNTQDGPSCKADCLNIIWRGIHDYEVKHGTRFETLVMQDCEDVIHPLAWRLYNSLIARYDMVQLPVLSMPRRWWQWTAAHYQDEFAQLHFKDLVARSLIARSVPAAGVGVAFARDALARVAAERDDRPFNTRSLAEDYDIALQMHDLGLSQHFALWRAQPAVLGGSESRASSRTQEPARLASEVIAIRELFPDGLHAAVRQKSRWVIGIALQAWRSRGWRGNWPIRLMMWRDRKVLITNPAAALGYLVAAVIVAQWLWQAIDPAAPRFPPIVAADSLTALLLLANLGVLAVRLLQRMICVAVFHGWVQGLWSIPRSSWGSLINALATTRALALWLRHRITGRPIGWDKTAHQFPDDFAVAPGVEIHASPVIVHDPRSIR